jgi:hypothetical protein
MPILTEIAQTAFVVPIARTTVVLQISERVLVFAPPRVECVVVLRLEALAVLLDGCRRRDSRRDDGVAIGHGAEPSKMS